MPRLEVRDCPAGLILHDGELAFTTGGMNVPCRAPARKVVYNASTGLEWRPGDGKGGLLPMAERDRLEVVFIPYDTLKGIITDAAQAARKEKA